VASGRIDMTHKFTFCCSTGRYRVYRTGGI